MRTDTDLATTLVDFAAPTLEGAARCTILPPEPVLAPLARQASEREGAWDRCVESLRLRKTRRVR
jgi:hypothetical protein